jgi:hypothetical protein
MKTKIEEITKVEVKTIEIKEKVLNAELSAKEVAFLRLILGKVGGSPYSSLRKIASGLYYKFMEIGIDNEVNATYCNKYNPSQGSIIFDNGTACLFDDAKFH